MKRTVCLQLNFMVCFFLFFRFSAYKANEMGYLFSVTGADDYDDEYNDRA